MKRLLLVGVALKQLVYGQCSIIWMLAVGLCLLFYNVLFF